MKLFTKSAFKQALFCPASLYYYYDRENYANQNNEDDFLQALADGGNQAGDLAKVYYNVLPGADLAAIMDYDQSVEKTSVLLKQNEVNIAEAAFRWGDCFVRADIIEKKANVINLIEVKAKSWNPDKDSFTTKKNANKVSSDILEYVYDVAFQKYVIQNALGPGFKVVAHLMLANKTIPADYDGINQLFPLVKVDEHHNEVVRQPEAKDLQDPGHKHILTAFPEVDGVCDRIIAGATEEQMDLMGCTFKDFVKEMSHQYVNHERHYCPVSANCFNCPFYTTADTPKGMKDGKKECWQEVEKFTEGDFAKPSVSELWCGLLGGRSLKKELVAAGKYFLEDVKEADIPESKPAESGLTPAQRRLLQIGLTTGNKKMLEPFKDNIFDGIYVDVEGLKAEMKKWKFPLHMIDFETTAVALPLYKGLRPYEQVAFQFSHHIIEADGSIRHAGQYLNTKPHHNPNFEFVEKLKEQLEKDNGTIFRYATHENSILRALHGQLDASNYPRRQELMDFIDTITHYKEGTKEVAGPRDMVDLLEVVRKYYYHPSMKGSNSIKAVLPAVLNSSAAIQAKYSKPIYGDLIPSKNFTGGVTKQWIETNPDGTVKLPVESPYHLLDSIATFLGVSDEELERFDENYKPEGEQIANGGAALAAYTKLQFSTPAEAKALAEALLRYCELDTMSMVFIWEYFHENTGI